MRIASMPDSRMPDSRAVRKVVPSSLRSHTVRGYRRAVHVDSLAARWIGALAVLSMFCWLVLLLARDHHHSLQAAGRLAGRSSPRSR